MRPPITLNRVDLPQPEGPITDTNSPGATAKETWSTAVRMPSGVSNCLTMSSTTRIGLPGASPGAPAATRFDGVEITAMLVLAPPAGDVAVIVVAWLHVGRANHRVARPCSKVLPATTGSRHDIAHQARWRHEPQRAKMSLN